MTWYLSDCGEYVARRTGSNRGCMYDVFTIDGSKCWLSSRYDPTGWDDPRLKHAEFAHEVIGYSLDTQDGRDAFRLTFADLDQAIEVKPLKGNTIIQSYEATFCRPIRFPKRDANK